jgi:hypothetical protein
MKAATFVVCLLCAGVVYARNNECSKPMPKEVEAKLLEVLDARRLAGAHNDWLDKDYDDQFQSLLDAKDPASSEARVALMDYYVGEANGEDLVCAVALDGARSKRTLERYIRCDVAPSRSPVPRRHDNILRHYALTIIDRGDAVKSCTFE